MKKAVVTIAEHVRTILLPNRKRATIIEVPPTPPEINEMMKEIVRREVERDRRTREALRDGGPMLGVPRKP